MYKHYIFVSEFTKGAFSYVNLWTFYQFHQLLESIMFIEVQKKENLKNKFKIQSLTSNRSLSASISTASCSSPKELTQAVPPQEAVLTLKAMVLIASPMHIINLINPLSGVAFVRNSSYTYTN